MRRTVFIGLLVIPLLCSAGCGPRPKQSVRVDYDKRHQTLTVTLESGQKYIHTEVPRDKADALKKAESKGVYYYENIRDEFPMRKAPEDASKPQTGEKCGG